MDAMLMILPPPCSRMMGATSWPVRSGPSTLTANTLRQNSRVMSAAPIRAGLMPALFTSTSIRPSRACTSATKVPTASQSPTWHAMPKAVEPVACSTSAATWSQVSCLRLETTTVAPAAARPSTIARPIPLVEPVTMATRPVRSKRFVRKEGSPQDVISAARISRNGREVSVSSTTCSEEIFSVPASLLTEPVTMPVERLETWPSTIWVTKM